MSEAQFVRSWAMTLGSNFPPFRVIIAPGDGDDLTTGGNANLTLKVIKEDGTPQFQAAMSVDSATQASYAWTGTEFSVSGCYWGQIQCVLSSGKTVIVPRDNWFAIRVIDPVMP